MKKEYYVYILYDYKRKPFYVGITKNLSIRLQEHISCDRKNLAKDYRIRRCIEIHGTLIYKVTTQMTLELARKYEKRIITKHIKTVVNKQFGRYNNNDQKIKNKRGQRKACPVCGKLFWRLKQHKCKQKLTQF